MVELVRPTLLRYFKPALLGRLVIVPYYPLGDREIGKIARLKLATIQQRFTENHRVELTYGEELISAIAARCTEVDTGARNVDHILTQNLLPELSGELLKRMALDEPCTSVHIYLDRAGGFAYKSAPSSSSLAVSSEQKRSSLLYDWSLPRKLSGQHKHRDLSGKKGGRKRAQKTARTSTKRGTSKRSGGWLEFLRR